MMMMTTRIGKELIDDLNFNNLYNFHNEKKRGNKNHEIKSDVMIKTLITGNLKRFSNNSNTSYNCTNSICQQNPEQGFSMRSHKDDIMRGFPLDWTWT